MTCDIPNAYIQAMRPPVKKGEDRVIMKITGSMVDLLLEIDPIGYDGFVVIEKGKRVVYVEVQRAIYGHLESSLLWYKKFRGDLESAGFKFNPYDPCVANRVVRGKQHTIRFHVDDVMSSHVDPKVNDEFLDWCNMKYGEHGKVKATRGKIHVFLGVTYDFSEEGFLKLRMEDYVNKMVSISPGNCVRMMWLRLQQATILWRRGKGAPLDKVRHEEFHSMVARGLFLSKRARPDIQPVIAVLATRVSKPNESDWGKLVRFLKYLNGTKGLYLRLSVENLNVMKWSIDASFGVHADFKSHTGGTMSMGEGAIISTSKKQKLNTRSSTEAELVAVDDVITMVLWTKMFLSAQGYDVTRNIIYQDNKSAILLEKNGRQSAGKRSRAINLRYFFVTDQVEKGNVMIEYCPTDDMISDFMTKPLQARSS